MKRSPLHRSVPLGRSSGPRRNKGLSKGRGFAASPAQRLKVRDMVCLVCGSHPDPAHLCPRSWGGCDDAACVIPLCRPHHRAFDRGGLSILGELVAARMYTEIAHALGAGHYNLDLLALLHRVTGERYLPERRAA